MEVAGKISATKSFSRIDFKWVSPALFIYGDSLERIEKSEDEKTQYLLSIDLDYMKCNIQIEGLMKEVGSMLYRVLNPIRYPLSAK